jgi:peptide-methionine (R)-S-oxide reductase
MKSSGKGRTEEEWRKKLNPDEFNILREKGTEMPFTGKYVRFDKEGKFLCRACGNILFDSGAKFDSHCGWPSFYEAKKGSVKIRKDFGFGMERDEAICAKCGSHLGHVFKDAPQTPTGDRYCINSLALDFKGKKKTGKKRQEK